MRRSLLSVAAVPAVLWLAASAGAQTNYTQYLGGGRHPSFTTDAQITKAAAAGLHLAWSFKFPASPNADAPKGGSYSSPTVYNHRLYIGAMSGQFYALNAATGAVIWSKFLGYAPSFTCAQPLGIVATAAVGTEPNSTNTGTIPVVYEAGPDGYVYAFDGRTGAQRWKSVLGIPTAGVNDYFSWASPTLVGDRLYVGFSSNCDRPWIRGGLAMYDRHTGQRLATWYAVPSGSIGGGVWTSAAATSDAVWVTTGSTCDSGSPPSSGCKAGNNPGDSYSLVKLNATTLAKVGAWRIPDSELNAAGDPDFGASPVVFNATVNGVVRRLVGACDKNGYFYAIYDSTMTLAWKRKVGTATDDGGDACLAAAIYDNQGRLFLSSNNTTLGTTSFQGAVRRVNPATGTTIWSRGLKANVLGTPSENGDGVLAAAGHDFIPTGLTNEVVLMNAETGAVISRIAVGKMFPQPVFADDKLFLVNSYSNTVFAYKP